VLATLWPTPDDTGEFFADFYRRFQRGSSPGEALREAQLAALRSGTWRARPGYWATYFVVGKE
jgi:CHAT domain-containing protein